MDAGVIALPRGVLQGRRNSWSGSGRMGNGGSARPIDGSGFRARKTSRVLVNAEVLLGRSCRRNYRVRVFDASPLGCKVEFVERPQLDEQVWVRFDSLAAIPAAICWVEGCFAGVAFDRPIHPAVFDDLLRRLR
jgi:hypothetical protein